MENNFDKTSLLILMKPMPYTKNDLYLGLPSLDNLEVFNLYSMNDNMIISHSEETAPSYINNNHFRLFYTPLEKLRFSVTYFNTVGNREMLQQLRELVSRYLGIEEHLIHLCTLIQDKDGDVVYTEGQTNITNDVLNIITSGKISLEEFIFSPKYNIVVDNAVEQTFKKLYNSCYLDLSNFLIEGGYSNEDFGLTETPFSVSWLATFEDTSVYKQALKDIPNLSIGHIITFTNEDELHCDKFSSKLVKRIYKWVRALQEHILSVPNLCKVPFKLKGTDRQKELMLFLNEVIE